MALAGGPDKDPSPPLGLRWGPTLTRLPPDCDPGVATLSRGAGEGFLFFPLALRSS
jgi:hypothetical protein